MIRVISYAVFSNTHEFKYNAEVANYCNPGLLVAASVARKRAVDSKWNAKYVLDGDSIASGAQLVSKKFLDLALPGSRNIDLYYRIQQTTIRCMPEKVAINCGGNDVIQNTNFEASANALVLAFRQIKNMSPKRVLKGRAWVKVSPVVREKAELQIAIEDYNTRMEAILRREGVTILDPWPILCGEDGFMRSEFVGEDRLHWNLAGYLATIPLLNAWYES